ncbi:transposable element Tc3 transposase [Trichonephila clavipes]|uniref:Transposable element Tc3 transposase n=1 Tax=Trichonephila clavipes TaxID=2585209 RepID=A0A8X6RHF9_TRICX|nr:transposable element Tc3 transposase [Trichonephila clavipes]
MDDSARPHRILALDELLESEDITRMDFPAYSLDLNPIEHLWDALGRRTAARLHHPQNTQCETATAGSDVVQSGRPIFDEFFQHLWPYISNNTANVVFQMIVAYPHRPMT